VAAFSLDAERHVLRLSRELAEGSYRPGPYRLLPITDPKRRLVAAAPVRDRVVHHALHRAPGRRRAAAGERWGPYRPAWVAEWLG
jgi:hypothetical protein